MRFSMGGGQGPSLGEYLEAYGLSNESGEPVERLSVEAEKEKAREVMREVTAAFGGGAVRAPQAAAGG